MTLLPLPALRSDDTLGFLAALGVLELCTSTLRLDARLGWEGIGGGALLESRFASTTDLAGALAEVAKDLKSTDQLVPGDVNQRLIPRRLSPEARQQKKHGGREDAIDPLRTDQESVLRLVEQVRLSQDQLSQRWIAALLAQIGPPDAKGQPISPLLPTSNQMVTSVQLATYRDAVAANGMLLIEAFEGWRRYEDQGGSKVGVGALLDNRAIIRSVDHQEQRTEGHNRSVPGATWLALNSIPFFRIATCAPRALAVGWHVRPRRLTWPVWTRPLDTWAVEVLLAHPAVAAEDATDLAALGVMAICRAASSPYLKSNGVMMPPVVTPVR